MYVLLYIVVLRLKCLAFFISFSISYYMFICLHVKVDIVIIIMSELFHCYKPLASFSIPKPMLTLIVEKCNLRDVMDTNLFWLPAKT